MPYKDKAKQNAYQNKQIAERRSKWLTENGPCLCGSSVGLVMLRKSNAPASVNHRIWSYSEGARKRALKHYLVKCKSCAKAEMKRRLRERYLGKNGNCATLTPEDVWAIRGRLLSKESERSIGRDYGIHRSSINKIKKGELFAWLVPGTRKVAFVEHTSKKARVDDQI